jgi:hypothetical protein
MNCVFALDSRFLFTDNFGWIAWLLCLVALDCRSFFGEHCRRIWTLKRSDRMFAQTWFHSGSVISYLSPVIGTTRLMERCCQQSCRILCALLSSGFAANVRYAGQLCRLQLVWLAIVCSFGVVVDCLILY